MSRGFIDTGVISNELTGSFYRLTICNGRKISIYHRERKSCPVIQNKPPVIDIIHEISFLINITKNKTNMLLKLGFFNMLVNLQ